MYDLLWHLRGSVNLDSYGSNDEVLNRLEVALDRQQKPVVARGPDYIEFCNPLWRDPFGTGSRAMVLYDHGRFWIEHGLSGRKLRYDLRSLHALVFCLLGGATAFVFGALESLDVGLKFGLLAFGWLYGGSILLALARVPRLIRKTVRNPT